MKIMKFILYWQFFNTELLNRIKKRWLLLVIEWLVLSVSMAFFKKSFDFPIKIFLLLGFVCNVVILSIGKKNSINTFIILFCIGLFFAFTTPIFDSPDEPAHFSRALYITEGNLGLKENSEDLMISQDYEKILKQFHQNLYLNNLNDVEHLEEKVQVPVITATSAFAFYAYLPQCIGIFLGRVFNLSVGGMFYLGRITNLLVYSLLAALAMRISKNWSIPFLFVAALPMAVYQAASYNPDGLTIGLSLITIALYVKILEKNRKIGLRDIAFFTLICMLLAGIKLPYVLLVGLIVFISPSKFEKKYYYAFAWLGVLLVGITAVLWFGYYSQIHAVHTPSYVNANEQIIYICTHIQESLRLLFSAIISGMNFFLGMFTFGWLTYGSDEIALLYLFVLGGVFLFYPFVEEKPNWVNKLGIILVLFGVVFLIYTSMYITWTAVGGGRIDGVQGRYFIGIMPLVPFLLNISLPKTQVFNSFKIRYDIGFYVLVIYFLTMVLSLTLGTYY